MLGVVECVYLLVVYCCCCLPLVTGPTGRVVLRSVRPTNGYVSKFCVPMYELYHQYLETDDV